MNDELLVKEVLDEVADRVHSRPPLREEIDRSMRRVRRRRRVTRAAQTFGALVAVVAVAGGVQVSGLPLPGWAPAVKVGPSAASALAGLPTRGSLAHDTVWLRAFREHVATFDRPESGGERWRAPSADAVDVIFAGDVGAYRVAVVETPLRWGAIEVREQITYAGPAGAAATTMEENGNNEPQDVVHVELNGAADVSADAGYAGLLVGPTSLDVQRLGPATVQADGLTRIESDPLTAASPGVWQLVVPSGAERVYLAWSSGEHVVAIGDDFAAVEDPGPARTALLAGVRPAERAGSAGQVVSTVPDDTRLAASVASAQYAAWQPQASTTRRLVWSGTLGGTATDLVDVASPSGGHALVAVQADGLPGSQGQAVHVVTAAKGADVAMAWTYQGMQEVSANAWQAGGPFRVAVVGPRAAVRAVVATSSGTPHEVDLADGIGWAQVEGATSVTFLDGAGQTLATAKVKTPDADATLAPTVTG